MQTVAAPQMMGGLCGGGGIEPPVLVRCTPGGPLKPWPGVGGPGVYGPDVG